MRSWLVFRFAVSFTSSQVFEELGLESVGVESAGRLGSGNRDQFEHSALLVVADDEEAVLSVVLVSTSRMAFLQACPMSAASIPCFRADRRTSTTSTVP